MVLLESLLQAELELIKQFTELKVSDVDLETEELFAAHVGRVLNSIHRAEQELKELRRLQAVTPCNPNPSTVDFSECE